MSQLIANQRDKIIADLYPQKFGKIGLIWTGILLVICAIGAYAYYRQLRYGLRVTAMRDYVSWGIYISNFVFFCCDQPGWIAHHSSIETVEC